MAKVTITIDDTNPGIVAAFGADVLTSLANSKGYTDVIPNPDYVPAVGSPEMEDVDASPDSDGNFVMVTNPDYVSAIGEPTISNTTRANFVGEKALKEAVVPYLLKEYSLSIRKEADTALVQASDVLVGAAKITTS
jgi:hypothetical protein